jgi:uncharacterized membrane protein
MISPRISFGAAALIAAMFAASLYALAQLPHGAIVPIHFGFDGTPNGWAPAPVGLLLLPAMAAALSALFALLPRIDPRGGNLLRSEKAMGTIWLAVTLLCAAAHALVIAGALHIKLAGANLLMVLIGGFFVVVGNVFGKLRTNYMVGIRTPWTLADERVWDQTHRFGGRVFVAGGLAMIALCLAAPAARFLPAAYMTIIMCMVALPILKSYTLWRARVSSN